MVMIKLTVIHYSENDSRFGTVASYWSNLVFECRDKCKNINEVWDYIHAELSKYDAKFKDFTIEFEDESQASLFILRYS